MGRNVLVVVSDAVDPARLTEALAAELEPDCTIKVVGSPSLSRLDWLTNDEDGARREAQQLAETGAQAIDGQTEPTPGDPIPEQAAEDALRTSRRKRWCSSRRQARSSTCRSSRVATSRSDG